MILVTGATGMFGGRVLEALLVKGARVRALTHSPDKAQQLAALGAEPAVGNLDHPETLPEVLQGVERVFLVTPMDSHITQREVNMINAAQAAGVRHVVKLYGAVRHHDDPLDRLHKAAIEHLKQSRLAWTLISPNTVMETNLMPQAANIRERNTIYGAAGDGRIGMVAAKDCGLAAATVLTGDMAAHHQQNYEITGPEAITYAELAARMSRILGREIRYEDMPVDEFGELLVQYGGYSPDTIEFDILCHFRALRRGDGDLVTHTFEQLTGQRPTSIDEFIEAHRSEFEPAA